MQPDTAGQKGKPDRRESTGEGRPRPKVEEQANDPTRATLRDGFAFALV